jgi:hypothetical protein
LRFGVQEPKKQHLFLYEGTNTTLESLKLCFSTFDLKKPQANTFIGSNLLSFVHLFRNLQHLSLVNTPIMTESFFTCLLLKLPIKSLKMKQCVFASKSDEDLFAAMALPD